MNEHDVFKSKLTSRAFSQRKDLNNYTVDYILNPRSKIKTQDEACTEKVLDIFLIKTQQHLTELRSIADKYIYNDESYSMEESHIKKVECYLKSVRELIKINYLRKNKNCFLSPIITFYMVLERKHKNEFIRAMFESWLDSEV